MHQRAKEIFGKLVDLPLELQAKHLERLCSTDAQLKREVASLLDFHTARSLMAEPPKPRIRHRSTLKTTRLQKSSIQKVLAYLPIISQLLLLFAAVLPLVWYLSSLVKTYDTSLVSQQLEILVSQRSGQLIQWNSDWQTKFKEIAAHPPLQKLITELTIPSATGPTVVSLDVSKSLEIQRTIEEALAESVTFCLWDKQMRLLSRTQAASDTREIPGWTPFRCADLMQAASGASIVRLPGTSQIALPPPLTNNEATAFFPVRNASNEVIGTLVLQSAAISSSFNALIKTWIRPELAKSFDTYVVDKSGRLVSDLRFTDRYKRLLELIKDDSREGLSNTDAKSTQSLLIRDPGINLLNVEKKKTHFASWPLTLAVQSIADAKSGSSAAGYRNYVGQNVAGAWNILPEQGLGVVMELPYDEAFELVSIVNRTLIFLLSIFCLATLISSVVCWPKRRTRNLQSVGPYKMQELLGEGGMGKVYLAEHSLLCRPTAIKILSVENADLSVLMRFEREVQLASQLTHPNTISIYDFGRNDDGLFYYAMEYIDGGHLGQLVEFDGPLPPGRCIYLVRQLCFALREAHLAGVVHRDIKPQNVMLCDRGGEPDFIKLVDYGLVKAFVPGVSDSTSQTNFIIGTPRFMAPERLQSPWLADPRVDIYSIGALIYYMLTGDLPPLVTPTSVDEPAQVGAETLNLQNIAPQFSRLLEQCMSYDSSSRPSSVASLLVELDRLSVELPWHREDSEKWWQKRGTKFKQFLANKRKNANGAI